MTSKLKIFEWFYKKPEPFVDRREVNWPRVFKALAAMFMTAMVLVLFWPAPDLVNTNFHEGTTSETQSSTPREANDRSSEDDPPPNKRPSAPSYPYQSADEHKSTPNSSMIVSREGNLDRDQLPPGVRFNAHLNEPVTVSTNSIPVIGTVDRDVEYQGHVAIPQGSQLFGSAALNGDGERVDITWKSVQLSDGAYRALGALTLGRDNQSGVAGEAHSDSAKNAVGATMARFVGAFAEGSMQEGMLGANVGGTVNGLRNAVGQTAQDQANSMADSLQKERHWVELSPEDQMIVILSSPFKFREPGGN